MCYMMSKQQYLSDQRQELASTSDVFCCGQCSEKLGSRSARLAIIAANDPEERATIFMVWVGKWSDGTPARRRRTDLGSEGCGAHAPMIGRYE